MNHQTNNPLAKLDLESLSYVGAFFKQAYDDECETMAGRPLEGYSLTRQQARQAMAYENLNSVRAEIEERKSRKKEE